MRIQLDVDAEHAQLLDELKKASGSKTYKELFNNAMTLLRWAISQRKEGRIIASVNESEKTYNELRMPALERIAVALEARNAGEQGVPGKTDNDPETGG